MVVASKLSSSPLVHSYLQELGPPFPRIPFSGGSGSNKSGAAGGYPRAWMSYSRGRRFEWIVKGLFESRGWVTVRAARSKPIDLVALKDGRILLIECKYNVGMSQRRRELLMDLARRAGARPILATKKRRRKGVKLIDVASGGELSIEEI
jgi:Holliday junction resolvase